MIGNYHIHAIHTYTCNTYMIHADGPDDSICMYMHVYACIVPVFVSILGYVAAKHPETVLHQELCLQEHRGTRVQHSETTFIVHISVCNHLAVNLPNHGP